jgi:hypothetical protein
MDVYIKNNEHVFIPGMTQSGKTFLAEMYLMNVTPTVYVLDTKGLFDFTLIPSDKKDIIYNFADLDSTKTKRVIYKPVHQELNKEYYEKFFEYCLSHAPCIAVVDEVMQVCDNPFDMTQSYKGILTRGMQLGVAVWSLTQRPSQIPRLIMSESTHYFVFKLNDTVDREKLSKQTGYKEFLDKIPKRYFLYYNTVEGDEPELGTLKPKRED